MSPGIWQTITESQFPWEREALEFVRSRFPAREPYRAWSNFEFIADDGSINEVDLLVLTPVGFFLVEIKSRPGIIRGDAGTWIWQHDGKLFTDDNPILAADRKAKKLKSLLERQKAIKKFKGRIPFLDPLIFCSAPDQQNQLTGTAACRVCLRDRDATAERPARPGIMAAVERRDCPGLEKSVKCHVDRPTAKAISQAMDQAGIRPSKRSRKVSDFVLSQLLLEGPGFQDWQATHVKLEDVKRRVRVYLVRTGASAEDRQIIERAALREFHLLETLQHPNILRTHGFTEHELGPALIFEHFPKCIRLDHYMAQVGQRLTPEQRIELLRQIAEVVRFAHDKRVIHRALSPQSILIVDPGADRPQIKVFNWQVGYLEPFLSLRKPPRWDLHAERYATAVTLYELATGNPPKWGDGKSDPALLDCEATIDAEVFDASIRDQLTAFFTKALRRNPAERFDNAEEMLRAWRNCFEGVVQPKFTEQEDWPRAPSIPATASGSWIARASFWSNALRQSRPRPRCSVQPCADTGMPKRQAIRRWQTASQPGLPGSRTLPPVPSGPLGSRATSITSGH